MALSYCATLGIHILLCWALVFKTGLNYVGGALAMSISIWSNVIFLGLYMRYSEFGSSFALLYLLRLAWWSYELLILLSGLSANPQLETSVLSVCFNTIATLYTIPFGIGAAASIRVSNELGAGNPYGCHLQSETRVARGCGWQHIGVYINLVAFYLCGIPTAVSLAFWIQVGGKELWIGIQVGAIVQCVLLSIITSCINWEQLAMKARQRLFDVQFSADNRLV